MKAILHLVLFLWIFTTCFSVESQGQSSKYLSIKTNLQLGLIRPLKKNIVFPLGYSDAQLFPQGQTPNIGFQYSLALIQSFSKSISIGFNCFYSDLSFTETGQELNFWTNSFTPYIIERAFKMHGLGVLSGCTMFENRTERLQVIVGVNYCKIQSAKNVHIYPKPKNRMNIQSSLSLEYGRLLMKNLYLVCGFTSSVGLRNFYHEIDFNPLTYGFTLGLEKKLNLKKK